MEFEPNSGPPTPMPDFDELFPPARDPYATGNGFKVNVFMSFGYIMTPVGFIFL